VWGKMINKLSGSLLMLLSVVPSAALIAILILEPFLYGTGIDRGVLAETGQAIRLVCALIVIAMILYFISHINASKDSRFIKNKSKWVTALIFGNVFTVPLFWFIFMRNR
jgi:hypothetical protein